MSALILPPDPRSHAPEGIPTKARKAISAATQILRNGCGPLLCRKRSGQMRSTSEPPQSAFAVFPATIHHRHPGMQPILHSLRELLRFWRATRHIVAAISIIEAAAPTWIRECPDPDHLRRLRRLPQHCHRSAAALNVLLWPQELACPR